MAEMMTNDPTGLTMPVAIEELFWGDAGIGMAIMGSGLAAAGILASGSRDQVIEWVPQCYGDAQNLQIGAFCASNRCRFRCRRVQAFGKILGSD